MEFRRVLVEFCLTLQPDSVSLLGEQESLKHPFAGAIVHHAHVQVAKNTVLENSPDTSSTAEGELCQHRSTIL